MKTKTEKRKAYQLIESALRYIVEANCLITEPQNIPLKRTKDFTGDKNLTCAIKRLTHVRNRLLNEISTVS